MTGENEDMGIKVAERDELLRQLFHLKGYEAPEASRMARNRQNILREVREAGRNRRKTLGDLVEVNFPWFFAEPKYGVAMLFVAFAGLQYLGFNARNAAESHTGIYTSSGDLVYEQVLDAPTNQSIYAEIPGNFKLFDDASGDAGVSFVERLERRR